MAVVDLAQTDRQICGTERIEAVGMELVLNHGIRYAQGIILASILKARLYSRVRVGPTSCVLIYTKFECIYPYEIERTSDEIFLRDLVVTALLRTESRSPK